MKKILLVLVLAVSAISCIEEETVKLNGKYSVEFLKGIDLQNENDERSNYINFNDSIFGTRLHCNNIQGNYSQEGNKIKLEVTISTRMMCPDDSESKYLMALSEVNSLKKVEDQIVFLKGDEILLKIKAVK